MIGIFSAFKFDILCSQIKLLLSYQLPGLKRWQESFISTFFFQVHPFITILALYSIYVAFRKKDLKFSIISYLMLLIILGQIERARYIIPAFPMLTLMSSYGVNQIKEEVVKKFIVCCIVISSLTIAVFAYLPFVQRLSAKNLKDAGCYLNSIEEENIKVFVHSPRRSAVNPAVFVPILDLFTEKHIYFQPQNQLASNQTRIKNSSLRFTWEYKNPKYYEKKNGKSTVVVISNDFSRPLPNHIYHKIKDHRLLKAFEVDEKIFRTKIFIRVYCPI
jgi:hypothetical protein